MDALDQAVRAERSFIRDCSDVPALLDRMAEYRDFRRQAVARSSVEERLRADDLLELAEARISALKARALRESTVRGARDNAPTPPATVPSARPEGAVTGAPPADEDPRVTARERLAAAEAAQKRAEQRRQEAQQREQETRRLARELDEIEARIQAARQARRRANQEREASLRQVAQQEAALRQRRAELARLEHEAGRAPAVMPPARPDAEASAGSRVESDGCAPAKVSAAAPAPDPPERQAGIGAPTGDDLVRFRQAHGLTQREAAARLGVAHGTVGKAEAAPGRPLSPQLAEALLAASGG